MSESHEWRHAVGLNCLWQSSYMLKPKHCDGKRDEAFAKCVADFSPVSVVELLCLSFTFSTGLYFTKKK